MRDKPQTSAEGAQVQVEARGDVVTREERTSTATSSGEDPEIALAAVENKLRTLGTAGRTKTLRER